MIVKINGVQTEWSKPAEVEVEQIKTKRDWKYYALLGVGVATFVLDQFTSTAMAASSLNGAFKPVTDMLLDLADPLAYIMFVWGAIEGIVGRPSSGLNRMKWAALGYIALNWIPVVMDAIRAARPV